MNGCLVVMVGASGAGKDSLLRWLAQHLDGAVPVRIAQRWITRAAHASEDHLALDAARFEAMRAAGDFALHWTAHGTGYGIGREIDRQLAQGDTVVINGSRAHLAAALARYPQAQVVLVRVRPEVLAARLRARGRETMAQIEDRLARHAALDAPLAIDPARVHRLDNDGALDDAGRRLLAILGELNRRGGRDRPAIAPDRPRTPSH